MGEEIFVGENGENWRKRFREMSISIVKVWHIGLDFGTVLNEGMNMIQGYRYVSLWYETSQLSYFALKQVFFKLVLQRFYFLFINFFTTMKNTLGFYYQF